MKTQTFILLLAFVLVGNVLAAQDKYEYATIASMWDGSPKVCKWAVSKSGSYEELEFKIEKGKVAYNFSPLLEYIEKMSTEGWEINAITNASNNFPIYHLRKKKN